MPQVYSMSMLIVACVCALAVLHPRFVDTLCQRIGLSIVCIAATAQAYATLTNAHNDQSSAALGVGMAIYALSTVWKYSRLQDIKPDAPSASQPQSRPAG